MGLFEFIFKKKTVEEKPATTEAVAQAPATATEQTASTTSTTQHIPFSNGQAVCFPTTFADIENLIIEMRDKTQPALVNLSQLDLATAQRYVDVLSGAVLALNGSVTALQKSVYYFHPNKK